MIIKLQFDIKNIWMAIVSEIKHKRHRITFQHLGDFVTKETKNANDPFCGRLVLVGKK